MRTVLLLAAVVALAAGEARRPNFVLMMADDHRWDELSCAGNPVIKTPNLDRIAAGGARCRQMFVVNSLCGPSRATFLTGQYSHANGVLDNGRNATLRADVPFLPDLLRQAGYAVGFCGKSHIDGALRDRTWDLYFGYKGQGDYFKAMIAEGTDGKDARHEGWMDDIVTDRAVRWIKERSGDQPWCLFLWFKAPHRSWNPPPRHRALYADAVVPEPPTWAEDAKGCPGKPAAFRDAANRIGDFADCKTLDFVKDHWRCVTAVDDNVGKVLAALDETKAADDTVVLHTGDNGFFLGEWRRFDKRFMHEPSIRVPLVVRYPRRIAAGTLVDAMALNIDLAPTVLDLAGVPAPKAMHGRSLVSVLTGAKPADWRQDWLYEYYEFPGPHSVRKHRGVRSERWKLIHYHEAPEEWELYDLAADPGELRNLADDPAHAATRAELTARIAALRRESGDLP